MTEESPLDKLHGAHVQAIDDLTSVVRRLQESLNAINEDKLIQNLNPNDFTVYFDQNLRHYLFSLERKVDRGKGEIRIAVTYCENLNNRCAADLTIDMSNTSYSKEYTGSSLAHKIERKLIGPKVEQFAEILYKKLKK